MGALISSVPPPIHDIIGLQLRATIARADDLIVLLNDRVNLNKWSFLFVSACLVSANCISSQALTDWRRPWSAIKYVLYPLSSACLFLLPLVIHNALWWSVTSNWLRICILHKRKPSRTVEVDHPQDTNARHLMDSHRGGLTMTDIGYALSWVQRTGTPWWLIPNHHLPLDHSLTFRNLHNNTIPFTSSVCPRSTAIAWENAYATVVRDVTYLINTHRTVRSPLLLCANMAIEDHSIYTNMFSRTIAAIQRQL